MSFLELLKYALKKLIDFRFKKRSPFYWGIKYFSISLVTELAKLASDTALEDFYQIIEIKGGLIWYTLVWILINVVLGGVTIVFGLLSIIIKLGLVLFFSFLEYKKTTSSSIFRPNKKWFEDINKKFYTEEIKNKYIPELHQDLNFQSNELQSILNFENLKGASLKLILELQKTISSFDKNYKNVQYTITKAKKELPNYKPYKIQPDLLNIRLIEINRNLKSTSKTLNKKDFRILKDKYSLDNIKLDSVNIIDFKPWNSKDFENWLESERATFTKMVKDHNEIIDSIISLNHSITKLNCKSIFVSGNAGVGKTHLSAHLYKLLKDKEHYPIIISAKKFSGNSTNLNKVLLDLLDIPVNENLKDVLIKLNKFARKQNKRVYFIFDGLNETTDHKVGFNKMWGIHLESFTKQIEQFSHLFLICTFRKSYIERIWISKPNNIVDLNGFSNYEVESACKLYFDYYKIKVSNLKTANLGFFHIPLLLGLFCKLKNNKRINEVTITLNIQSYIDVFKNYISYLKEEVRVNKDLASLVSINNGFKNSATRFLDNNNAICNLDDFISDFDNDLLISNDNSIAKAVLEGYLIFIKDYEIGGNDLEIITHTHQEVGGYLLANKLHLDFAITQDLVDSSIFKEKLIGKDEDKIHQLRFDILKFLVALKPDLIVKSDSEEINELSWWYIYNTDYANLDDATISHITSSISLKDRISIISDASSPFWFNKEHPYNFAFIYNTLKTFSQWDYDLSWNLFIYSLASEMRLFIKDYNKSLSEDHDQETLLLKTRFIITLLSSNIRELRDLATSAILKFGIKYSKNLLDLSLDSKNFKDIYIYERMILCCYGVTLKNQNDDIFVNEVLPIYAENLFKIQFAQNTKISVYNYIVTDSIKHIIDLSILKGVFELNAENLKRVSGYKFTIPFQWIEPTEREQTIIDESREMNPPDPLKMDFGIYTIPRLIDREHTPIKIAIANVWSRINQLDFKILDLNQEYDQADKDFHWGSNIYRFKSKVDRLGKKYCWIAFFDYAGKLLLENNLDVKYKGDSLYEAHYERLGDVDIDISKPNKDHSIKKKLFFEDLLKEKRKGKSKWNQIDKTDLVEKLFTHSFETLDFTLLYGFIDQKQDDSYETRSFLLIESIFIDKDELPNLSNIENNLYDWEDDISMSPNNLSDVYFGELYWADSVPSTKTNSENFPTGRYVKGKKTLNKIDLRQDEYKNKNIGDIVEYSRPEKINIETEPTLMDYRWESNSELFKTYDQYIPSSNIGKSLDLKSDCVSGNILDKDLNIATKSIKYEDENYFSSNYSFLRTDLLKEYMDKNNLALVYQVKQHSYSQNSIHYRKLKFSLYKQP